MAVEISSRNAGAIFSSSSLIFYQTVYLHLSIYIYIFPCSGKSSWRSGVDLGQLYDNATPSPTGSLSGPYFVESPGKTVIGVKGKTSNLACSIKNLGNLTVIRI